MNSSRRPGLLTVPFLSGGLCTVRCAGKEGRKEGDLAVGVVGRVGWVV